MSKKSNVITCTVLFLVMMFSTSISAALNTSELIKFSLTVATVDAHPDDTVVIPITLDDLSQKEKGVNSLDVAYKYDPKVLEIIDITSGEIMHNPAVNFSINFKQREGEFYILYMDETGTGADALKEGVLVNIHAKIKTDSPTGFSEIYASKQGSEQVVKYQREFVNGGVNVIIPLYGDVNSDGKVNTADYALIKQYVLGIISTFPGKEGIKKADINGDGDINSIDCVHLKRILLYKSH